MTDMPMQSDSLEIPERPFGRMIRSVLGYALLMALMFLTPLVVFVPAALFLCGIRNGQRAAWLALLIGAVAGIGIGAAAVHHPGATAGDIRLTYAYLAFELLALALPAMLVFPLMERGASFGKVLITALLIALPGLALTEFGSRALLGISPYADQLAQFQQVKA
jgi:hypothetical protein